MEEIMNTEPIDAKVASFGWEVIRCHGHDFQDLLVAFDQAAKVKDKPSMIIADTRKGRGISFMENTHTWHYGKPTDEQMKQICHELDMVPEQP